jgi:hypothetical protein
MALPDPSWLAAITSRNVTNRIWGEGDSYMAGANGVALNNTLRSDTGRIVISTAVGGSTLDMALTRMQAYASYLSGCTIVIWDGSPNGYTSVAYYLGLIDQIVALVGKAKLIIIRPAGPGPSADGTVQQTTLDMEAVGAGLTARGIRTFDPIPVANALVTSPTAQDTKDISARVICQSLLFDQSVGQVHLAQATMNAEAATLEALLTSSGL